MNKKIDKKTLNLLKNHQKESYKDFKKVRKNIDFIKKGEIQQLETYKRIVEHMTESIWIGDENERTVYANPNFCKIMGYSLEEMIGRESYDFRDKESAKTVQNNNNLRKDGEASKYEGVLRSKDGILIPVLCSGTPIPGGGTVGIMTDLREVKSLEKSKEELKELNRSKDEFISIVGHELRTPLTIADGYLSMIIDGDMGEINDTVIKSLEKVYNTNKSLISLINDMLDLSKMEMGSLSYVNEEVDILELSETIFKDLSLIYKDNGINFNFYKVGKFDNKTLLIDSNRFKQVIVNLINNAFKFTTKGGNVDFEVIDLGNSIEFRVRDSGIGINKSQLKKIFEKFHQIESCFSRTNEGLGLGLSIISGIVKNYNSEINIKSEHGKGSEFFFKIKK